MGLLALQDARDRPAVQGSWLPGTPAGLGLVDVLERAIAVACGYDFVVGVSSAAHKEALLREEPTLKIVVTGCKR